jgi:hypothetical protein
MSIIDKALEANRNYARNYTPTLGKRPISKIAVVTCMDPPPLRPPRNLGSPQADIDFIPTGGHEGRSSASVQDIAIWGLENLPPAQTKYSSGRYCARPLTKYSRKDGKDIAEATWKPHEKHGRMTMQSDLPLVYGFPKQRKKPLTDAQHVRNVIARFDQVIDVSDANRALAFANIEKAANYYDVNLAKTSWHDLGIHSQKNSSEAAAKGVKREQRVRSQESTGQRVGRAKK